MRSALWVLAAGLLLSFAFPEPDLAPIAWVAPIPLLVEARRASWKRGFALGAAFGFVFFGALLIWISIVGWVAWAILVILQALFLGLLGAGWALASRVTNMAARVAAAASLWVGLEFLRAVVPLQGFTWGELAQSQHNLGWMLKAAHIGGGWGIALLIMVAGALIAEAWEAWSGGKRVAQAIGLVAAAGVVIAAPVFLPANQAGGDPVRVAIVQGNVPRNLDPSYEKDLVILGSHRRLTADLPSDVDIVVWPESSVAIDPDRDPVARDLVAAAARDAGAPMIVGGTSETEDGRYLVMAFQISPGGDIVDRYQKTHLVPFGEYVPARDLLDWIPLLDQVERDAVAGTEPTVFDVAGGKVAAVISFEGDFGSLVRQRIGLGGRLLVVATNTSTWRESWASAQHVAMSKVRAAENGVWVAHAALSGISAFVDPNGEVVQSTKLWSADTLIQDLRFADSVTFYAHTGDWLPLLCLVVAVALAAGGARRGSVT